MWKDCSDLHLHRKSSQNSLLGLSSSNSKTHSGIIYMGFLRSFFPKKSFLKCSFLIFHIKTLLQTNFYMGESYPILSDRYVLQVWVGFLKSFCPQKSFLKCPFLILHIKTLLQTFLHGVKIS